MEGAKKLDSSSFHEGAVTRPIVYAGIVTHDPDIDRLGENIAALYPQVDRILIFDNASQDVSSMAKIVFGFDKIEVLRSSSNVGMARALNALCKAVSDDHRSVDGQEFLLAMDQDSIASAYMVDELLRHRAQGVGIVAPLVHNRNTPHSSFEQAQDRVYETPRVITSGSLIALDAHRAVGGYNERLFMDWVDIEFCLRLREAGYKILVAPEAHLLHDLGRSEVLFNIPWFAQNKLVMRPLCRTNHPLWRQYDVARSWAILLAEHADSRLIAGERAHILTGALQRLVTEKHKMRLAYTMIKGYLEGRAAAERKHDV